MASINEQLKQDETGRLISADKVKGTAVHNPEGESLGTIENIMIDKPSGKVAYAVLAFGGILGMGKDRRALPWEVLEYHTEQDAYVINVDTDRLRNGPAYSDADTNWEDPAWGQKVHDYYDVKPSWNS
jgi:sporulation protein YlmC with PRC-barrel domain